MRARYLVAALLSCCAIASATAAGCGRPGMGTQIDLNGDPAVGAVDDVLAHAVLRTTAMGDVLSWETSPWAWPDPLETHWIQYSPHALVHVTHPLGREPAGVLVYISFVESGSTPALAAGDLARIVDATEDDVTVWNDTNGTYFARIVLF